MVRRAPDQSEDCCAASSLLDVVPRDHTTLPGAGDRLEVDARLGREMAHHR